MQKINLPALPIEFEELRDQRWRREDRSRISDVFEAERFIEEVGFANCLTDSRTPGPSLYVAVCGRRDAVMPPNVQKDEEASASWLLKDDVLRRGKVYYGKLAKARTMFVAPRMVAPFFALWGVTKKDEKKRLSATAQAVLKVLRKEWEMATSDLREECGIADRKLLTKALDELQSAMLVVPSEVVYKPKFTYIWTLTEARFPEAMQTTLTEADGLREIARCFLTNAGMTYPGELARVIGAKRPAVGLAHRALVHEGFAVSPSSGTYQLASFNQ